ncbi:MAG: hypothetical protein AAF570_26785, partial [Bacteroidota bacterium]
MPVLRPFLPHFAFYKVSIGFVLVLLMLSAPATHAQSLEQQADSLADRYEYTAALARYSEALKKDPENETLLLKRFDALARKREYDTLYVESLRLQQKHPENYENYRYLTCALVFLDRYAEAGKYERIATYHTQDSAKKVKGLLAAYKSFDIADQYHDVFNVLEEARRYAADPLEIDYFQGRAFGEVGAYERGIPLLKRVAEKAEGQ